MIIFNLDIKMLWRRCFVVGLGDENYGTYFHL